MMGHRADAIGRSSRICSVFSTLALGGAAFVGGAAIVGSAAIVGTPALSHVSFAQPPNEQAAEQDATAGRAETGPQQPGETSTTDVTPAPAKPQRNQAELEAEFSKMLSGATLEGSFTMTAGRNPNRLSTDTYTLGEVKKVAGNVWMFPTRIQYGGNDYTVPLPLPIQWAGDTPVIIVDNFTIPGRGTFSARVMFFADHYAGYWKHGDLGGHLFGIIHRAEAEAGAAPATNQNADSQPARTETGAEPEK